MRSLSCAPCLFNQLALQWDRFHLLRGILPEGPTKNPAGILVGGGGGGGNQQPTRAGISSPRPKLRLTLDSISHLRL